jgi:alpha-L-rhamnosidase
MNYIASKVVRKKVLFFITALLFGLKAAMAQKPVAIIPPLRAENLICEYKTNPIAIEAANPRLSWKLLAQQRNVIQTAYEVRVGTNAVSLTKGKSILWTSGKVTSDQSVHVNYGGPALSIAPKSLLAGKGLEQHGQASPWSMVNSWKMGLLHPEDWTAQWIQIITTLIQPAGQAQCFVRCLS